MKRLSRFVLLGFLLPTVTFFSGTVLADMFEVTVTNLTAKQTFTPILAAAHKSGITLFTLGAPASLPLEYLAEGGDTGPLEDQLTANPDVEAVIDSGSPLPAGGTVKLQIKTKGEFNHISVAAMLVPTNDGFFALNDIKVPNHHNQVVTLFAPAYDAGTEADDESCMHIPGPPSVCNGEGFNPDRDGVNFVHIHSGIHGIADLKPQDWDWRNPVAKISIKRIRK